MNKNKLLGVAAGVVAALASVSSAQAHQYYNLTGAGAVGSADSAIGFGIANSINGTDGVSANSNGTNRIANGTNTYDPLNPGVNNLIPGTGTAATTATEIPGNLPYMWYSGQHSKATGVTKREHYTGSSVTDNTGNMLSGLSATASDNTSLTLPNGQVLNAPAGANWGTNNTASLWNAYNAKNTGGNAATWGTTMADLPVDGDHPYQAVAGNSTQTSLGLDYGLIHVSCGANTAADNCASLGDILTTITIKNDSDYAANNGLLDVALYRNVDTSLTSDRNAQDTFGASGFQGSSLGDAIWTASMSSVGDTLFYSFIFDQSEWLATGTSGYETNGFYTLVIGAHGGTGAISDAVLYDVLVTTSPVPVPGAVWLFGSVLAGFMGFGRRKQKAVV
ncbi:hypothetical protein A1359_19945 [Methylomonas lenta]|uniref:PEP-CTERM protein-sorting domain-containing protein n=1 Tax=Methylomonas lenta TaxID=980561 RepID=A0A177NSD4_9GAMM|nr:hypothetical protein [Methylomonas lenta]OAI20977.1 hypothetical protein A1359_19945 [Methylomonas lenta]